MTERIAYGAGPEQFGELTLPVGDALGVVTLLHGGFWRARWDLDLMRPLADDLAGRGWASWNLEYRRVGQPGGGWPGTYGDVRDGVSLLGSLRDRLQLSHHVVVGHSAGGTLALWAAAGGVDSPAAPDACVSLAGVCDLAEAEANGTGDGAVADLLGGDLGRAALASPSARPAGRVPTLLVHGTEDTKVPVGQSRTHAERLRAQGVEVTLLELEETGHMELIDPDHDAWDRVVAWATGLARGQWHTS